MGEISPYAQFGFHTAGAGGNPTGIGEFVRQLQAAGRPAVIVCVDGTVGLIDALAGPNFHPDTILVYRTTYNDYQWMYSVPIAEAARTHWEFLQSKFPPELVAYKARVWLAFGNEMAKEQAEWVHGFSLEMMKLGNGAGYRMLGPNWAAGTPEPAAWRSAAGRALLEYLAANPKVAALGLHEYSYDAADLFAEYPHRVGRFTDVLAAADEAGLARPTIIIKEFGWALDGLPGPDEAIKQIAELVRRHPNYPPAPIWYLGPGYGNIATFANRLIAPLGSWLRSQGQIAGRIDEPPIKPPPTVGRCGDAREPYARTYVRVNEKATWEQYLSVARRAFENKWTLGFSADDAGIGVGLRSKRVIEVGEQYPRDLITAFYNDYCVNTVEFQDYDLAAGPFDVAPVANLLITQGWNANPGYYSQWYGHAYGDPNGPLNGHAGIDLRAPTGTAVVSVWPGGRVKVVETDPSAHNFGIHVRVEHSRPDGHTYELIYAHLQGAFVRVGDILPAGGAIGAADNTGNSFGSHLHLALKKRGATAAGQTTHPSDLIDPTPFLQPLLPPPPGGGYTGPALPGHPLNGLHDRANRHPRPADYAAQQRGRFNAMLVQSGITEAELAGYNTAWKVCRIFETFDGRTMTPAQFVDGVRPDLDRVWGFGVRHFVAGNEPNIDWENPVLTAGAAGADSGYAYGEWLLGVHQLLREIYPGIQLGWPALSPGFAGDIGNGWREEEGHFLDEAQRAGALDDCDFITCHSYYASQAEITVAFNRVKGYRQRFPNRWVLCTEYGSPSAPDRLTAGRWAGQFYRLVASIDPGCGAFYFLVSGAGWENWALVDEAGNDTGIIAGMLA